MKEQVLSIEQMKHLQGLGLDTSNASMCLCCFRENIDEEWELEIYEDVINQKRDSTFWEIIPTFTLQDIIEMLPRSIQPNLNEGTYYLNLYYYDELWVVDYLNNEGDGSWFTTTSDDSFIKAAYQMLCWCVENGYLKGGEK
jgi:hypothetical protein